jgi:branched-chain amino acid transport system permease protein
MTRSRSKLASPGLRRAALVFAPAVGLQLLQLVVFPMPLGSWFFGVVLGLLAALVALGMALVYRANRILNFAQGDLGTVPTVLAVGLIGISHVGYFLGFFVGLGASLLLGGAVELLVIRRFFRSPRLLLTVATIGLSQLFIVAGLLLPRWLWGRNTLADQAITVPGNVHFSIGSQIFRGSEVLTIVVAPLLLLVLALFLRRTDVGIVVRASADSGDRAALLGIPVKRVHTLVWMLASSLSFVGVFLRAGAIGMSLASQLSLASLVVSLAALVLGRLENLPAITASAVALGILEQGVRWNEPDNPGFVYLVFGVVILGVLVLRRSGSRRSDTEGFATWSTVEEVRSIPAELRSLPVVRCLRWGIPLVVVIAALLLPNILSPSQQFKAATVAVFAVIALSVVVLTGWAGQVSLGQMSFVGVGGAVGALATAQWHSDLSLAMLVAGAAGAVVAMVVGLPALRVRGLFLAATTLAFALASSEYLLNRQQMTWIPRQRLARPALFKTFDLTTQRSMYYLCLAVLVLAFLAATGVRRSRSGRALVALRDNERGAQSFGINVVRTKLMAFALSGFLAAVAGCLLVHINQAFTEGPFTATKSIGVFTAAVVGGLGSLPGAVIGALYLNGGTWFLSEKWQLLPSAVGVLVVLMVLPGGLGNLLYRARDAGLRWLARQRKIVVPSLSADPQFAESVVWPVADSSSATQRTDDAAEREADVTVATGSTHEGVVP